MTVGDGSASLVVDPPFVEGLVGPNEEALLGGWSFGKGIRHVGAKDEQVLGCRDGVKEARTGLVNTIGLRLGKDTNHT